MNVNILAVDDEKEVLDFITAVFSGDPEVRVDTAASGREALDRIGRHPPDLVILDWRLPDMPGPEVCLKIRRDPKTAGLPVLMLTSEAELKRKVAALEGGADDYLVKPPHVAELKARVKALLRRKLPWLAPSRPLEFGGLKLEPEGLRVSLKGKDLGFTAMEFNILYMLASQPGHIVRRRALELRVLGAEEFTRALDVHMSRIREKLGPLHAKRIETAKGLGYVFSP
jgi:two-component system phosphate regulon response regulator PhoB